MPFHLRELLDERVDLTGQGRRNDRLCQQAQAPALPRPLLVDRSLERSGRLRPGSLLAAMANGAAAIGIVERENRSLMEDAGRAAAGWMIGIAFDLDRPSHVGFHQKPHASPVQSHGRGIEQRLTGNDLFRRTDIRDDLSRRGGFDRASADAAQC